MSEPFGIELAVRQCESGTASARVQKAVAARFRERTSKLAKATERIASLEAEIARLREEIKPVAWGVWAKQSMAVPPGCASPRRVQPFRTFASKHEAQAVADRCDGVVFAIQALKSSVRAAIVAAMKEVGK